MSPLPADSYRGRRRFLSLLPSLSASVVLTVTAPALFVGSPRLARAEALLPELPSVSALRYQIYYGNDSREMAVAEITYRIEHGAGRYRLSTAGQAIGVVALFYSGTLTQTSTGFVASDGLRPERYTEQRGRRPERIVVFDHARSRMVGTGDPAEVALPPGAQDRLSVFFQLGLVARGRPSSLENGGRFRIPLASLKRIDLATFSVRGPEPVKTAGGLIEAVRVNVRNEADPDDPVFDVWLMPSRMMLPARIRMREKDGKVVDQVLLSSG